MCPKADPHFPPKADPTLNRLTHAHENNTLPQTLYAVGNNGSSVVVGKHQS